MSNNVVVSCRCTLKLRDRKTMKDFRDRDRQMEGREKTIINYKQTDENDVKKIRKPKERQREREREREREMLWKENI